MQTTPDFLTYYTSENGNVVECKSIPVKNECRLGQHDCGPQALCVDLKYGYTCQCPHNFIDLNAKKPGRNCQGELFFSDKLSSFKKTF